MIKKSFTLRVLVINFLLLALPLLIASFIFFQNSYQEAITAAKKQLREVANFRTYSLVATQPVKQSLLSELAYVLDVSTKLAQEDYKGLTHQLVEISHFWGDYQIFILSNGKKGSYQILASSERTTVDTVFQSYQQLGFVVDEGSGTFIRYMYSQGTERYNPYIFVARTIDSKESGKPIGILMVAANITEHLATLLAPGPQLKNAQFALLTSDGIVFAASDPHLTGQYMNPISSERLQQIQSSKQMGDIPLATKPLPVIKGNDPPFFEFIFNNQVQMAYQVYVPDVRLSIVAYTPKQEFFGASVRHFLLIYSIYGLILLGGAGITYWISLYVSRPLRQLSSAMGKVGQGNLNVRFHEEPLGFEINILGQMFNSTLDTLFQNIQKAEDERVKKETYQRELAIARQVQRSLLPSHIPKVKGISVAGIYLPATNVGGDFFVIQSKQMKEGEEFLVLAVADASGKGIPSVLYSLSLRSLLRSYLTLSNSVGEILRSINHSFLKDTGDSGMFATMVLGIYNAESRELSYYSCGHPPAYVKRSNGEIITLTHSGVALGLKEWEPFKTDTIQLNPGDSMIFYTDGLMEASNPQGQQFSENRIKEVLQKERGGSAEDLLNHLVYTFEEFTKGKTQEEETTIVTLRVD